MGEKHYLPNIQNSIVKMVKKYRRLKNTKHGNMFSKKRILIIGAHPDDIEYGMGGTLNKLKNEQVKIHVFCDALNFPGNEKIRVELQKSMNFYGLNYKLHDFTNMSFYKDEDKIKQTLYKIRESFRPDIIFSTSPNSVNSDHSHLEQLCLQHNN